MRKSAKSALAILTLGWACIVGLLLLALHPTLAAAQATVATGSVQGTILDPKGAVVSIAKVTITSKNTGQKITPAVTSAGEYNSGPVIPGEYVLRVEASGFKTLEKALTVQLGVVTPGSVTLELGVATELVIVEASAIQVNTEQATVQGIVTAQQIESLPINGRNFLDLAQLEPGVQIQDGNNFDPTKVGYSSISFGGRFGRTARIEVDGVDVSDETVGTTTENIAAGAIQEFQVSQSSLDLSNELTSSGGVNVLTKSGTNAFHGEAIYLFRDSRQGAALPGPKAPYQRNHMEGNVGGPIIKDKLFFFGDGVRIKQDLLAPVPLPAPFSALSGGFASPFRENDAFGKLDWVAPHGVKMFYRYSYFSDLAVSTFGAISFQPFQDKNYTRQHVVGADFSTGSFSHSIRFSYLKFQNDLGDVVKGSSLILANFPVSINIGPFASGPNLLAPQTTPQSNRQIKYDGSKIIASHIIRYGVDFNHIQGGGFAKFFSITPSIFSLETGAEQTAAHTGPFPSLSSDPTNRESNPLNWAFDFAFVGNGLGFSTEQPAFGFPLGGLGPDNRLGVYVGDTWKIKPNLTVNAGVRYVRDTGRTDSDLPVLARVNEVLPGFGNPVKQANHNFSPQLGLAWDPWKSAKTSIRAGIGIFYENVIFNNVLFDRPERLAKGGFLSFPLACFVGTSQQVPFADGTFKAPDPNACSAPVGVAAVGCPAAGAACTALGLPAFQGLADFQTQFQQVATAVGANATNANFLPNLINNGLPIPLGAFAPGYKSPRSIQMNVGIEREIRPGMVVDAQYVRNVGLHYLLGVDVNHTGDTAFFNKTAAVAAIARTLAACNAANITAAASPGGCTPLHPISPTDNGAATMVDFGNFGLDSPGDLGVGACGVALGFDCAFAGHNPNVGEAPFLLPVGRSVYNGLLIKLRGNVANPVRGIRHANYQFSYALSRFQNSGGSFATVSSVNAGQSDEDFVVNAPDNRDPLRFTGDSVLDRRHQFSFGGWVDLPLGFRVGTTMHFYSPLATTLVVPSTGLGAGEIFRTDFTGDGTVQDILPGTQIGSFGRDITASNLNGALTNYNNTVANNPTPAGQVLIDNGLFTLTELQALGGVAPTVPLAPAGQVNLDWARALDMRISWAHRFKERFSIEPSASFYNLLNFANFDPPAGPLNGLLNGSAGSVNGTTYNDQSAQRIGVGTGVFALGAPRAIEFGLRISF